MRRPPSPSQRTTAPSSRRDPTWSSGREASPAPLFGLDGSEGLVGPDSAPSPPAPRKRARECCDEHVQQQSPPRRAALLVAVPAMEIPEEEEELAPKEEELAPKRGILLLRPTRRPAGLRLLHAPRVWDGGVRGPAADVRAERTCRCCRSRARAGAPSDGAVLADTERGRGALAHVERGGGFAHLGRGGTRRQGQGQPQMLKVSHTGQKH